MWKKKERDIEKEIKDRKFLEKELEETKIILKEIEVKERHSGERDFDEKREQGRSDNITILEKRQEEEGERGLQYSQNKLGIKAAARLTGQSSQSAGPLLHKLSLSLGVFFI